MNVHLVAARMLAPIFAPLLGVARAVGASAAVHRDAERWLARFEQWGTTLPRDPLVRLSFVLLRSEFRALSLHRIRASGPLGTVLASILGTVYRGPAALYLDCPDIGPGLYLEHAFATVVNADRIGENCWINQQVTIGYGTDLGRPTLGDRVYVRAGAIIIGGIYIGDDAVIGAGAVVTRDVPAGHVAVGPRATTRARRRRE